MKSGGQSMRELDYIRTGDGLILYNISEQWRSALGGQGENSEYKALFMKTLREIGNNHLKETLNKEAGLNIKDIKMSVARTGEVTPGYFLSINILPTLSDEEEAKARPLLDKVCIQTLELLHQYRTRMIQDALANPDLFVSPKKKSGS